ncbi:hypothetical protein ASE95_16685 [Sphingomonas sp. Leaf231]|nr:hypothetical protein ASE95_16685 [Sphingomonas sp. Leaf231]
MTGQVGSWRVAGSIGERGVKAGMAAMRKTITPTGRWNTWIAARIDAGRHTDDSEAIRDRVRANRRAVRGKQRKAARQGRRPARAGGEAA